MIWFLIPVIVLVVSFYHMVIRKCLDGRILGLILCAAVTAMSFFGAITIGGVICALAFDQYPVKVAEQSLLTIRDKEGIEGSFFLGTGSFENKPYYFYYVTLPNGGARPERLEANARVTIFEEDRQDAKLVWWQWKYDIHEVKTGLYWWFVIPVENTQPNTNTAWAFHVPKGTIRTGFSM